MTDVTSLDDHRLRRIRVAEAAFGSRLNEFIAIRDAKAEIVAEVERWETAVETARATGTPAPVADDETRDRLGVAVRGRSDVGRAMVAYVRAGEDLGRAIGEAIADQQLREGDEIRTSLSIMREQGPLIVAETNYPPADSNEDDRQLGEVTLTEDGLPVETRRHNVWLIDGTPDPNDLVPIRFERWWAGGFRVGGTVHAISRGLLDTE